MVQWRLVVCGEIGSASQLTKVCVERFVTRGGSPLVVVTSVKMQRKEKMKV